MIPFFVQAEALKSPPFPYGGRLSRPRQRHTGTCLSFTALEPWDCTALAQPAKGTGQRGLGHRAGSAGQNSVRWFGVLRDIFR